jgi:hypothetical protein
MSADLAERFRPVAPPRVIEDAYAEDAYHRVLKVVRENGPWPLILAENFKSPEELIAAVGGVIPEGVKLTWEGMLNGVFRGYLARQGVCFYPELNELYYNSRFLELVRGYWGAKYAEPETFLFNIQGPTPIGGPPHLDGTVFRGMTMENTPIWLLLTMSKSGLFQQWQSKKAQLTGWFYKGRIGGGFNYWPDGPRGEPKQIKSPMWGRAVLAENEMMFHHAQACGPVGMRQPNGLDISSTIAVDPTVEGGWRIETFGQVTQQIPPAEMRLLLHWGARVFMDMQDLKRTLDHTDDITHEQALNMLIDDARKRGAVFETPTDPMKDQAFIAMLSQVYDVKGPANIPADVNEEIAA